jgi:hypothetical protein
MSTGPQIQMPTSILGWIIWLIIIIAAVGVLYVVIGVAGVTIPAWIITIGWILAVAFVAIAAIKFLSRMS